MDIEDCIVQIKEVFDGEPWYGSSILKVLENIPVEFWNQKVGKMSHSIAELVYHIIDWRSFVVEKLKNNTVYSIELNSEKDWRKQVSIVSQDQKKVIIKELNKTQELILEELDQKSDSWLNESVLGKDYSNQYMINGLVQHDIYHLGQINMLYNMLK